MPVDGGDDAGGASVETAVETAVPPAPRWRRLLRAVFLLGAVAAALAALWVRREEVLDALPRIGVVPLVVSAAVALAGTGLTMLSWRALLADLGSPIGLRTGARVFFLAQLGKYVPGSVWALVAQVELGRAAGVPARRSAAVGVLALLVSVAVGAAVVLATAPVLGAEVAADLWWTVLALPVVLVVLHPAVLRRVAGLAQRLARRPGELPEPTLRGLLLSAGWQLGAWVAFGLHVGLLVGALAGFTPQVLVLSLGAFTAAWLVGFVAVVVPAGVGVREAVLVLVLAPVLSPGEALVVALVSRAVFTVVDLALAGTAAADRRRTSRPA